MNTSDALQLIAVVIAINALITCVLFWAIKHDKELLEKNIINLKKHIKYTESLIETMVEWLVVQEKKDKVLNGWILKHMAEEEGADFSNKFRSNSKRISRDLKVHKQELMLHSTKVARRESAFKQLAHAYGDIDTYIIMSNIIELKEENQKYKIFLNALKERLKEDRRAELN